MAKSVPGVGSEPEGKRTRRHALLLVIVGWIAAGAAGLVVLAALAVTILLHSVRVHSYVLSSIDRRASETLGTKVQLENFTLHLSNLSLDLYGLTVHGAEPYPNPPLLQVQHAEVGIRVVSVLRRKWYLDTFEIDSPVVKVFTDAQGVTNIPTLKSSGGSSNTNLFDLGVRHALLKSGEVYYNNRKSILGADLHDVEFRAAFDTLQQKYSGSLSYKDGHLVSGTLQTFPHSLDAQFDATRSTFHLSNTKLSSGSSQVLLNATLNDYSHPAVQATYDASLDGQQIRDVLGNPSVPVGFVQLRGSVQYQDNGNQPLLDDIVLAGDLTSQQLDVRTPTLRVRIANLLGHYSMAGGKATVQDLRAGLLGGELNAKGTMTGIGGNSHTVVDASARGISLAALKETMPAASIPKNIALNGVLNADTKASWGKTLDDLVAHANATVRGSVTGRPLDGSAPTVLPVESQIEGDYSARGKMLSLAKSYVRTPQTTLTLEGAVSDRSSLDVNFQANDLAELETVADLFRAPVGGHPAQPLGLSGTASFQGTVQGSTSAPRLAGLLTASNLQVEGTAWRVLRTNIVADPSFASLQNADLEPASQGKITFNASTGLSHWAFTKTSEVKLDLAASQLGVAELKKLAGSQIPVDGTLNATVRLHGTELNPVGQGDVSLTHVTAYQEPIQSVRLTFSGTGQQMQANLGLQMAAGKLQGTVSVRPQQRTYTAQVDAAGFRLDELQAVKTRNLGAKGVVNLHAAGQGSFDNPQLQATVQIPRLDIQDQTFTGLDLGMNVANHVATASLVSSAINTSLKANAKVALSGEYMADVTLDTQLIPLQPLLAIYAPAQAANLTGQTEIHATLRGPLKNKNLLEVHVSVPTLTLAYGNTVKLAAASPIHIDYKDGVAVLQRSAIRGTDTDLQFQGSLSTINKDAMSVLLLGTVDMNLAQLFNPDIRSSGKVQFDIHSSGASNDPNLAGQIRIVDANYASGDLPLGLQHGNGVLTLTKSRLDITSFEGTVGGGKLTAQGGVVYRPSIQFDLGLATNGVRLLYPQGVRETLNSNLRLAGTTESAILGGSLEIADLSFTPAFDLTNFISQFSGGIASPPTVGFSQNLNLNVGVRSSNNLSLVSRTLTVDGSANLQLRGTAAQPVILGRVNLNSGDVIFNGDRFVLNGGMVEFVNPSETEPVVNLALNTSIQQYSIYMRFNGPISQLRTNYSSDPALPSADIINLLAFGQTTEANAANPSTPANQAAESLIASQVSSQVTSRFSKIAGISQLSINPVLAGGSSQGPAGANITIQQRVTGNLFVTFSSNVASTQNQTIMGQYQLTPRFAVSATRDQTGGFAVDTQIKKTW